MSNKQSPARIQAMQVWMTQAPIDLAAIGPGYALGIDVQDPSCNTSTSEMVLKEGTLYSIEPGNYLSDRLGIRLEDALMYHTDRSEIQSELAHDGFTVET